MSSGVPGAYNPLMDQHGYINPSDPYAAAAAAAAAHQQHAAAAGAAVAAAGGGGAGAYQHDPYAAAIMAAGTAAPLAGSTTLPGTTTTAAPPPTSAYLTAAQAHHAAAAAAQAAQHHAAVAGMAGATVGGGAAGGIGAAGGAAPMIDPLTGCLVPGAGAAAGAGAAGSSAWTSAAAAAAREHQSTAAAAAAHQQNPYANGNEYPGYGGGAVSGGPYGYVGGASTAEEELQLQQAAAYHSALSPDATAFNPYSGAALTPQTQTQTSALTQLHGQPQHLSRMLGGVDQAQLRQTLPAPGASSPAADAELLAACLHYQQQAASARRQYQQLQAEHASFLHSVYGSSGGGTAGGGYGYGGYNYGTGNQMHHYNHYGSNYYGEGAGGGPMKGGGKGGNNRAAIGAGTGGGLFGGGARTKGGPEQEGSKNGANTKGGPGTTAVEKASPRPDAAAEKNEAETQENVPKVGGDADSAAAAVGGGGHDNQKEKEAGVTPGSTTSAANCVSKTTGAKAESSVPNGTLTPPAVTSTSKTPTSSAEDTATGTPAPGLLRSASGTATSTTAATPGAQTDAGTKTSTNTKPVRTTSCATSSIYKSFSSKEQNYSSGCSTTSTSRNNNWASQNAYHAKNSYHGNAYNFGGWPVDHTAAAAGAGGAVMPHSLNPFGYHMQHGHNYGMNYNGRQHQQQAFSKRSNSKQPATAQALPTMAGVSGGPAKEAEADREGASAGTTTSSTVARPGKEDEQDQDSMRKSLGHFLRAYNENTKKPVGGRKNSFSYLVGGEVDDKENRAEQEQEVVDGVVVSPRGPPLRSSHHEQDLSGTITLIAPAPGVNTSHAAPDVAEKLYRSLTEKSLDLNAIQCSTADGRRSVVLAGGNGSCPVAGSNSKSTVGVGGIISSAPGSSLSLEGAEVGELILSGAAPQLLMSKTESVSSLNSGVVPPQKMLQIGSTTDQQLLHPTSSASSNSSCGSGTSSIPTVSATIEVESFSRSENSLKTISHALAPNGTSIINLHKRQRLLLQQKLGQAAKTIIPGGGKTDEYAKEGAVALDLADLAEEATVTATEQATEEHKHEEPEQSSCAKTSPSVSSEQVRLPPGLWSGVGEEEALGDLLLQGEAVRSSSVGQGEKESCDAVTRAVSQGEKENAACPSPTRPGEVASISKEISGDGIHIVPIDAIPGSQERSDQVTNTEVETATPAPTCFSSLGTAALPIPQPKTIRRTAHLFAIAKKSDVENSTFSGVEGRGGKIIEEKTAGERVVGNSDELRVLYDVVTTLYDERILPTENVIKAVLKMLKNGGVKTGGQAKGEVSENLLLNFVSLCKYLPEYSVEAEVFGEESSSTVRFRRELDGFKGFVDVRSKEDDYPPQMWSLFKTGMEKLRETEAEDLGLDDKYLIATKLVEQEPGLLEGEDRTLGDVYHMVHLAFGAQPQPQEITHADGRAAEELATEEIREPEEPAADEAPEPDEETRKTQLLRSLSASCKAAMVVVEETPMNSRQAAGSSDTDSAFATPALTATATSATSAVPATPMKPIQIREESFLASTACTGSSPPGSSSLLLETPTVLVEEEEEAGSRGE